jgi:aminoglycoside 3-N-acetyltransferase
MEEHNNYISYKEIISRIDINYGDIVVVGSDLLRFMCVCRDNKEQFNPNIFIDSIIAKIGDKGTLLFPTFNWDFCKGKTFDYRKTLSQVGAINNIALKRNDFKRTRHPIYSFVVWGKDQNYLCHLDNISAWGSDSPFRYLYENRAFHLSIGIHYPKTFWFVHYVEEEVEVNYRFHKKFVARYIDENRVLRNATYSMYVRDLNTNIIRTAIKPKLDDILLDNGCYNEYCINGIYFGLVDLYGAINIMVDDVRAGGDLVYPVTNAK